VGAPKGHKRRPRRESGLPRLTAARAPLFSHLLYILIGDVRLLEGVGRRVKRNGNHDTGKNNADQGDRYGKEF
jgi:hypothetical protein